MTLIHHPPSRLSLSLLVWKLGSLSDATDTGSMVEWQRQYILGVALESGVVQHVEASSVAQQQVDRRHVKQHVNQVGVVFADSVVQASVTVRILRRQQHACINAHWWLTAVCRSRNDILYDSDNGSFMSDEPIVIVITILFTYSSLSFTE